jgi:hypothetical protein
MNNEIETLKLELAAFKKNNEELIHRCNAAVASWDEERKRALREGKRANQWKESYEDLEKYIRFIGKQIPCNTGGTFENDPVDAILDAAVRSLNDKKPERVKELNSILDGTLESWKQETVYYKEANDRILQTLDFQVEKAKVFECLAEMFYSSHFDNIDAVKKIYEITRKNYTKE